MNSKATKTEIEINRFSLGFKKNKKVVEKIDVKTRTKKAI